MMTDTDNLVLAQLRALRGENKMFREALQSFSRQSSQLFERLGNVEKAIVDMRGDIILLENKNLDRHSEVLDILCRLDHRPT